MFFEILLRILFISVYAHYLTTRRRQHTWIHKVFRIHALIINGNFEFQDES